MSKIFRTYWVELGMAVLGLAAINSVFLADAYHGDSLVAVTAGQLGDFVGGYIGTALTLFSVLLLVATLRKQISDSAAREFGEKYFQMLRLHRDNVAEIGIGRHYGRKVFVMMIREFRGALEIIRWVESAYSLELTAEDRLEIAYSVLFYGVIGQNSERMLLAALSKFDSGFVRKLIRELSNDDVSARVRNKFKLRYRPFDGHQSRLGHYYRHLYQTIKFVHDHELRIDKYEHIKTIRAQLSTHEQALLLLNSLTPLGRKWWDEELLVKYKLVKNIPREFFNPRIELDIKTRFSSPYFEWE